MPPIPKRPKLVNRGPAGLLTKLSSQEKNQQGDNEQEKTYPINQIVPSLQALAVDISLLTPDPNNARLHPERNMQSIKDSLCRYGQRKPIVARKEGMVVVAGNGTLQAAKELGWTKIAATIETMTDVEAVGYGLADNRTAELAKWDFRIVATLDKLLQEGKESPIGFTSDELQVLRQAVWVAPVISEYSGETENEAMLINFTPDQYRIIKEAARIYRTQIGKEVDMGNCIEGICKDWMASK